MLLSTTTMVKIAATNSKYYKDLGYALKTHTDSHGEHIDSQTIEVNINDLQEGSSAIVEVRCDYCGNIIHKKYKDYIKAHKIHDSDACKMCSSRKNKQINIINNRKGKRFVDLTGKIFGDLKVLSLVGKTEDNKRYIYKCECKCGKTIDVIGEYLSSGKKKNCGCVNTRIIDKTGKKYGRLLVTKKLDTYKNGHPDFECLCDCGNKVIVNSDCLRDKGGTKSCGCLNKENAKKMGESKFQDLVGQKFGRLYVSSLNSHPNKGMYLWNCKCDCGNDIIVPTNKLKSGNTQSCGCLKSEVTSERFGYDLTNKRFGRVTVLFKNKENTSYNVRSWHCICDCGNEFDSTSSSLLNGHTQSCGCLNKELTSLRSVKDITGQKFGKLTVIKRYKNNTVDRKARWVCKCDCGNESIHTGKDLRNGNIKSCGCENSKGEYIISRYLLNHGYNFEKQKRFNDCRYILPLPFDICIYNDSNNMLLCEFDGVQHFKPIKFSPHISDEDAEINFNEQKHKDKIKNEYCIKNNIPLMRIPYWEINNIELILDNYFNNGNSTYIINPESQNNDSLLLCSNE